jgi:methionyl-tRNA synthetase
MTRFFLTTAIDYVNSQPHLGTAYEKICADVIARYKRLCGFETRFLMGNDEHSQNVYKKAIEQGLDPLTYCDRMELEFTKTWRHLDVSFDDFIRTTEPRHKAGVTELAKRLYDAGEIYEGLYEGWYCVSCEEFKQEKDLVEGNCPLHPTLKPEWIREKNYFFSLSKYQQPLLDHFAAHPEFMQPDARRNEILRLIEGGLQDISVSRAGQSWGIPLPWDPTSVVYVWFDALINYASAVGLGRDPGMFEKWWPADLHVIGKDITRFHAVIWPAMLLSAGIAPPKKLAIHGFVNVKKDGQVLKMSKTLGTVIDPNLIADKWGPDTLRAYLLSEVAFGYDGDFSWDGFFQKSNANLGDNLGNLLNRVVSMTERYQGGTFASKGAALPQDAALKETLAGLPGRVEALMEKNEFHTALAELWKAGTATNGHIEASAPWTLSKQGKKEEVAGVLYRSAEALRIIAVLLSPFVPSTARRILEQLGIPDCPLRLENARTAEYIGLGTRVNKGPVLFQKIDANGEQP